MSNQFQDFTCCFPVSSPEVREQKIARPSSFFDGTLVVQLLSSYTMMFSRAMRVRQCALIPLRPKGLPLRGDCSMCPPASASAVRRVSQSHMQRADGDSTSKSAPPASQVSKAPKVIATSSVFALTIVIEHGQRGLGRHCHPSSSTAQGASASAFTLVTVFQELITFQDTTLRNVLAKKSVGVV